MCRSFGHVEFPKFQTGIFVEWKAPFDSEDNYRSAVEVIKTSVTANNSPIQDCIHLEDHAQRTYEVTLAFKPFTVLFIYYCKTDAPTYF